MARHPRGQGIRLSTSKIEYLQYRFSGGMGGTEDEVTIRGVAIPRIEKFRALGLIIQEKRDIDEDINKCIKVLWQKRESVSRVLCDKKNPLIKGEGLTYGC